jgi:SAM-dependent methyltransferase
MQFGLRTWRTQVLDLSKTHSKTEGYMNWTSGYVSDIEYTAGFYPEQNPLLLNFVAVLNGYYPIPAQRNFTYFELGFGRGVTINLLAANNPQGQFFAADFNPAHVAGASDMAENAQLDNLVLLERSFDELAAGKVDLPQFDYITLHGIYTWVDSVNRGHITEFIDRYLKPGGIVYVSFNALPGWAASMPLQRLLVEFGNAHPNRSDVQIEQGARFMQQLAEAKGAYFASAGPALQQRLDGLRNLSRNYLVGPAKHPEPAWMLCLAGETR